MLELHGFPVSNYHNMVKLALLEKGIEFREVDVLGRTADEAFRRISPRGKVPCLVTEQGPISETAVILEYLEQQYPQKPLLPADPYQRAQVLTLAREIELYIELAARLCYPAGFFGAEVDAAIREKSRSELLEGVATLKRHGRFAPYVAGSEFSLADIYFLYSLDLAAVVAGKLFGIDLLGDWPEAQALFARLRENPHVQRIEADKQAQMAVFVAKMRGH